MAVFSQIENVPPLSYDIIMSDPPWLYNLRSAKGEAKAAQANYKCMPIDDIKALPVGHLAARNCILWMWATHPMLHLQYEVVEAWGFRIVTSGVWAKMTKNGKQSFGAGYALRSASEPFIIGAVGSPAYARNVRTAIMAPVGGHSEKPDLAFREAGRLCQHGERRLELFGRRQRPGWDVMGDEAVPIDDQRNAGATIK